MKYSLSASSMSSSVIGILMILFNSKEPTSSAEKVMSTSLGAKSVSAAFNHK